MNIFIVIILCIICFGAGWASGIKNGKDIEQMVDGVDEGIKYLDSLDLDSFRLQNVSTNIDLLIHLDNDEADDARQYLIDLLKDEYADMQEDLAHEALSEESKIQMNRIKRLARKQEAFKAITSE